jgi:hypothetical protein
MSKDANASAMIILADSRELLSASVERFLPEGWVLERGTLETGDLALAVLPRQESSSARLPAISRTALAKANASSESCAVVDMSGAWWSLSRVRYLTWPWPLVAFIATLL